MRGLVVLVGLFAILSGAHPHNNDNSKWTRIDNKNKIALVWNYEIPYSKIFDFDMNVKYYGNEAFLALFKNVADLDGNSNSVQTEIWNDVCFHRAAASKPFHTWALQGEKDEQTLTMHGLVEGDYFLYYFNCDETFALISTEYTFEENDAMAPTMPRDDYPTQSGNGKHSGHSGNDKHSGHSGNDWDSESESESRWDVLSMIVDSREKNGNAYFFLYAAESFAYGVAFIAWMINWINDRHANTKLQKIMTLVPLTRICYSTTGMLAFTTFKRNGFPSIPLEILEFIFDNLNHMMFYVAMGYASYGMSTKRSDISCKKKFFATLFAVASTSFTELHALFGGLFIIPAGVWYVAMMSNVFSAAQRCSFKFLKDVQKMREQQRDPKGTLEQEKLETFVMYRFFLTIYVILDVVSWAVVTYEFHSVFAQDALDGSKQLLFAMTFGSVFRVKTFNKLGMRRKSKKKSKKKRRGRHARRDSQMSYRDVDYVGMDDLPPIGGSVSISMDSSPNALVVPQHLQGEHRQQYPPWKCEKCTYLNDGPMTHCVSCEVWNCRTCTMDNPLDSEICVMCDQKRPEADEIATQQQKHIENQAPEFWECDKCKFQNAIANEYCENCESWTCLSCTFKNHLAKKVCDMCQKERPSDLQMKLHRELEAKRRALEEAQQQNEALNRRLMQSDVQQQGQPQMNAYQPAQSQVVYQEAPRGIEDVGIHQAAVLPQDVASEQVESVEMDSFAPKIELRSVVSDGAIIVYDTPQGPPETSEIIETHEQEKSISDAQEEILVTLPETRSPDVDIHFVYDAPMRNSIVSDAHPIHFDDAPVAMEQRKQPNIIYIDMQDQQEFFTPVQQKENLEVPEQEQEFYEEDLLNLTETDKSTVTEDHDEQHDEESGSVELVEEADVVSISDTTQPSYTGTELLQFLMDFNADGSLSDEELSKLMKQIRENADDKQTLLESLDASQGNSAEFTRMARLMGFI